jgi:hypothetical protein
MQETSNNIMELLNSHVESKKTALSMETDIKKKRQIKKEIIQLEDLIKEVQINNTIRFVDGHSPNNGLIYTSKKNWATIEAEKESDIVDRFSNSELNSKAHDSNNRSIACRHLTHYVLSENMKEYQEKISSVKKIESIPSLAENIYDRKNYGLTCRHYKVFKKKNLGDKL